MQVTYDFTGTTPAGTRAPDFPKGFHVGLISKCEDQTPKKGEDKPKGFFVTIIPHPQYMGPDIKKDMEARVFVSYDSKNGFALAFYMAALQLQTKEQAASVSGDPTAPNAPLLVNNQPVAGLVNRPILFARGEDRQDDTDPNKKYANYEVFSQAEWTKRKAEAAAAANPVGATLPVTTTVTTTATAAPAAVPPVAATPAAPAAIPGLSGIPGIT